MLFFIRFTCFYRIVFDFYVFGNRIGENQGIKMRMVIPFDCDTGLRGSC